MDRNTLFEFSIKGFQFEITDDMVNEMVWLFMVDGEEEENIGQCDIDESMVVMDWLQTMCDRFNAALVRFFDDHDGTPNFGDWQEEAKYAISNYLEVVDDKLSVKSL